MLTIALKVIHTKLTDFDNLILNFESNSTYFRGEVYHNGREVKHSHPFEKKFNLLTVLNTRSKYSLYRPFIVMLNML